MTEENLTSEISTLKKRLEDATVELTGQSTSVQTKISSLASGATTAIDRFQTLNEEIATLTRKITTSKTDLTSRKESLEQLKREIQTFEAKQVELLEKRRQEETKAQGLTSENEVLEQDIKRLKEDLTTVEEQLSKEKVNLDNIKPDFEKQKSALEGQVEEQKQLRDGLTSQYEAVQYLYEKEYLKGRIPELQILDLIQDQRNKKAIAIDVITTVTGRPADFVEKTIRNLEKRGVIKIENNEVSLLQGLIRKEEV